MPISYVRARSETLSFSNGSSALVHFPLVKHERRSSSAGLLLAELEGFGARWGRPLAHAGKNEEAKGNPHGTISIGHGRESCLKAWRDPFPEKWVSLSLS
jgi:hypothetical protein